MARVLVTGAAGVVGSLLGPRLEQAGYRCFFTDIRPAAHLHRVLDLGDRAEVDRTVGEARPDQVLHLAGSKDVFACERDEALSLRVNVDASRNLADVCAARDVRLVFMSSDYVFAGGEAAYSEGSVPEPRTVYGRHKALIEAYLAAHVPRHAIIRTAGIYGHAGDFVSVVCKALDQGQAFKAFTNLHNKPTFAGDLFAMLQRILTREENGIFHAVGRDCVSRYEFALAITEAFALPSGSVVADAIDPSRDPRPLRLDLVGDATYEKLGYTPPPLREILRTHAGVWREGRG
jgi:dTDP-4-dehydrorhamnose reductase